MIPLSVSRHARERWADRFPGLDLGAALGRAEPVTHAKLLRWASNGGKFLYFRPRQEYAHDPVTSALFVLAEGPECRTMVTVIRFRRPAKTRRMKRHGAAGSTRRREFAETD